MNPGRQIKILLILMTGALILAGCAKTTAISAPAPIYGHSTGEIRTPISVLLILSHAPRLDESVQLTLIITSTLDAPSTSAEILLPPGAVATSGSLSWMGDLQAQQPQQLQATIKFAQEGDWTLQGKALRPAGGRDIWGDLAVIYLHVTREAGQVGFPKEPNAPHTGGQASPTITATIP